MIQKRNKLSINRIQNKNGIWLEDESLIADHAIIFYSKLFSQDNSTDSAVMEEMLRYIPTLVSADQNHALLKPITMNEVHEAVLQIDPESCFGSDGFSRLFFQKCWHIIGEDVFAAVQEFFYSVPIPKAIGHTFMVLLPKKDNPISLSDFRPISLCT